jgi:hypothetical protein
MWRRNSGPVLLAFPLLISYSARIGPPTFYLTAPDAQQHERRKAQGTGPMIGVTAMAVMTIITTSYYLLYYLI